MHKFVTVLSTVFVLFAFVFVETKAFAGEVPKEMCNNKDDDGDGEVDEDWPLGESCWSGFGPCRQMGVWKCGTNQMAICEVKNEAPYTPKSETYNGIDDDCDGLIDNVGLPVSCYVESDANTCSTGRIVWDLETQEPTCIPLPPTDEICGNDFDEDCNGVADICIGGSTLDGGVNDVGIDTVESPLGEPCRPVYYKEALCSYTPPSPHPLLPLSAVLVVVGAASLISRRGRLF